MQIRLFEKNDADKLARLFHQTVRSINIRDYSLAQVQAWAPDNIYFRDWQNICASRFTFVADDAGEIAGFGELEANGHIDCFYSAKNFQRMGVGSQIYQAIESKALQLGINLLFTEASITAKPFFERLGFSTIKAQEVSCRGEIFINYLMDKSLYISSS